MAYRKDINITKDIPPFRKILNSLTPSRNAAIIYFTQTLDITNTEIWMQGYQESTGRKINFLHLYVTIVGREFYKHPRLNRYVTGNRFYQRDGVTISVSAKKKKENGGKIVLLKLPVFAQDTVDAVQDRFLKMLGEGRDQEEIYQEKETRLFSKLPGFVLRGALRLIRLLDKFHLLPGFFVDPDPLYSSIVVANLGSVGLDAAYHHLYEYGNCPFFAVIGKTYETVVVKDGKTEIRKFVDIKYSFDERVEDGLACGYGLAALQRMIENPELLFAESKAEAA